jgi:hypothetical protein
MVLPYVAIDRFVRYWRWKSKGQASSKRPRLFGSVDGLSRTPKVKYAELSLLRLPSDLPSRVI